VLAGAAFELAVATRPTGALLLPGLLVALPGARRAYGLFFLGALPLAAVNVWYNAAAYGGVFEQGYAGLGGDIEFAVGFMPTRLAHYLLWLNALMTPLVTIGGLGGDDRARCPRTRSPAARSVVRPDVSPLLRLEVL